MVTVSSDRGARHFQRGRSVYTCRTCGRRTRETTVMDSDNCADCYDLAGIQNAVWDGCFEEGDRPYRDAALAAVVKKGGDEAKIRAAFADLFAA